MEEAKIPLHSSTKSMGPAALSLGDVLAAARSLYGNPWLSILRVPRRSAGLFVYLTPDEFGLTYSYHAFTTGDSGHDGGYVGEPTVFAGEFTRRGVTTEYWSAFTQNYAPTLVEVLRGKFSTLEGSI